MINKAIIIISLVFIIQLMNSCDRNCGGSITIYEVNYNSIEVTAWNTSGFNIEEVKDTIHKNSFGLGLSAISIRNQIAQNTPFKGLLNFSSAFALICNEQKYEYPDPIDYAEIFVINAETNVSKNATEYFNAHTNGSTLVSVQEIFEMREEWQDGFQFELSQLDSIPTSCIFKIDLFLKSGVRFSNQTQQINFFN